jgi:uncharacterized protein YndB with AHSA1/START domain
MNETLTTESGRHVLRMQRRLRHPIEKVWRALSEPGELGHWFPSKVELDLAPGGKIRFIEESDEYPSLDGEITDLDPPRLIAFTWDTDHLRWDLQPDGDGTLLTLTHTFDDRYGAASFASGWTGCIDVLELRLAGELAGPDNPDGVSPDDLPQGLEGWGEVHEGFVERFGLDEPTVRRTSEGWVVRVERQLVRPVEVVWSLLAGSDPSAGAGPTAGEIAVGHRPPAGFTVEGLAAGPVVTIDPPASLAYRWPPEGDPAGHVRWELSPGAGGARLVVTHTIPTALAEYRSTAPDAWRRHIRDLAGQVLRLPLPSQP